jgi:hypothetical protein
MKTKIAAFSIAALALLGTFGGAERSASADYFYDTHPDCVDSFYSEPGTWIRACRLFSSYGTCEQFANANYRSQGWSVPACNPDDDFGWYFVGRRPLLLSSHRPRIDDAPSK